MEREFDRRYHYDITRRTSRQTQYTGTGCALHAEDSFRLLRGGKGALIQTDKSATLSCNNDQTLFVPYEGEDEILYLVRKLTPTECASLQGFPKDWCALVPHKDTPEYKMWGNGMAYPCVLYVMEGITKVLQRRYLEKLFGGEDEKQSHS